METTTFFNKSPSISIVLKWEHDQKQISSQEKYVRDITVTILGQSAQLKRFTPFGLNMYKQFQYILNGYDTMSEGMFKIVSDVFYNHPETWSNRIRVESA